MHVRLTFTTEATVSASYSSRANAIQRWKKIFISPTCMFQSADGVRMWTHTSSLSLSTVYIVRMHALSAYTHTNISEEEYIFDIWKESSRILSRIVLSCLFFWSIYKWFHSATFISRRWPQFFWLDVIMLPRWTKYIFCTFQKSKNRKAIHTSNWTHERLYKAN